LLLNCDTLEYDYIPFDLGDYQLLVLNTNKHRLLQESKYNERVSECSRALKLLQKHYPINYLTDLDPNKLADIKEILQDDLLYRRVKYVICENQRVLDFTKELQKEQVDINVLAGILNAGHLGLKEDYEVSGYHLDLICELANQVGAIASRMTGAGFGGCAIAIVPKTRVASFTEKLKEAYYQASNLNCEVYSVDIVGCASRLGG
ncbi:MAG: galactokinase, partial [Bacilli bacterium]|nr:galactokinase [Bacilli bacterium]